MDYGKVAYVGGGNMARALAGGMLAAGYEPAHILISEPVAARRTELAEELPGVFLSESNLEVVRDAECIVLAVKPQILCEVCKPLAAAVQKTKPLIIGHRGVPHLHQENSLAGIRRALELGLDGVEFDVFVTRDEQVVLFHEEELERVTDGRGKITELTWDQVSKLNIKKEIYMGKDATGNDVVKNYDSEEKIPLLREVLEEYKGKLAMNVDIKPSQPSWSERHVGKHVARVIREAGADTVLWEGRVEFTYRRILFQKLFKLRSLEKEHRAIHSGIAYDDDSTDFMPKWLRRIPELPTEIGRSDNANRNPEILINALLEANTMGRWIGSSVVDAEYTLIDSNTIAKFHARAMAVGAYTLFPLEMTGVKRVLPESEQIERLKQLAAWGLDWVETDDPEKARGLIG